MTASTSHSGIQIPTPTLLSRPLVFFYLATLMLLPWSWFPPFPWLHEHAQWSDVAFAITVLIWAVERWRTCPSLRFDATYAALAAYFAAALFSLLFSSANLVAGSLKVAGIAELCLLAAVTRDLASHSSVRTSIVRITAVSAFLVGGAAVLGLLLFYAGHPTPLIGIYGELQPSPYYARVQAGTYNPNLLVSYAIFAAAVVGQRDTALSTNWRRAGLIVLCLTAALTFSRGLLGFVLAALIRNANTRKRRTLAIAVASAAVALMVCFTFYKVTLNPLRPYEIEIHSAASSSRYQAFTTALETLVREPLWGSGPATHPGLYRGNPFDSHMTYLNIAATLGLPALIAFTSLLVITWCRRPRPTNLSLWGGLAGLALDALGQDIEDFRHLWVLIGMASGESSESGESGESA